MSDAFEFERLVNMGKFTDLPKPAPVQQVAVEPLAEIPVKPLTESFKSGSNYAGDAVEEDPVPEEGYRAMEFRTPAHVLAFFSPDIQSGAVKLHKWQAEVNVDLAPEVKPTSTKPLKYFLVAANGSGKDAFVIAPFAIWFVLCKVRSRVIITSASGTQLTAQTENYIKSLAERVNIKLGKPIFKIRQRYIRCNVTGSEIRMFATDEAGKAEGYHPMEPNAEMAIIKNESKSIDEDIHKALKRCSGFNYWLEISSPGAPRGAFYRAVTSWKSGRKITSFDCPHISDEEREEDKIDLGESSAEYRSKHLALFTSVDGEAVITSAILEDCLANAPTENFPSWPKRVGIDLAAGCDESCVTITKGVKILSEYAFAERDTTITADRIEANLIKNGIAKDSEYIFADDGGIGHGIIDILVNRGWNIKRIHNQSAAWNKKQYGNKGAELWFRVKRILEECTFDIHGLSGKTYDQLINRKYKQPAGGKLYLQPKREAKAQGFNSPDRADAFVLSFTGLTVKDFLGETDKEKVEEKRQRKKLTTSDEVQTYYDGITFGEYEMIQGGAVKQKIRGSLRAALGLTDNDNETVSQYEN